MSEFHFLRPWWLLGLIPCMAIIWRLHAANDPTRSWRQMIAPELLPSLLIHPPAQHHRISPVSILAVCWLLVVLALSGPTWRREPAPFGDDTAVLAIVLKVTPSMQSEDLQPSRLARAVQKIHDLLELRPGAKTALIAYSGSAHQVLPLTTDDTIITSMAAELSPGVMPKEGDDATSALKLADQIVEKSGSRGWILWMADTVNADQLAPMQHQAKTKSVPVTILAMSEDGPERQALTSLAHTLKLPVVIVTVDDDDAMELAANTRFSTISEQTGERWQDSGYWLVPWLSAVCLLWFRKGWLIGGAT